MAMRKFPWIATLLAAGAGLAATNGAAQDVLAADYVVDRLDSERIEQLVARPMAQVEAGDVEGAVRTFDAMLATVHVAHGERSVEAADLLMAFGARLFVEGDSADSATLQGMAGEYVARSVAVYRAAFGPDHPEVAVALNSHADVLRRPNPDDPPHAAEEALAEAYRIRLAALGPYHTETLWTRLYLADVRGSPERTRLDPRLVDAVAEDLEETARLAASSDPETAMEVPAAAHTRRARLLARAGRVDAARSAHHAAEAALAGSDDLVACLDLIDAAADLKLSLAAAGKPAEAESVPGLQPSGDVLDCLQASEAE